MSISSKVLLLYHAKLNTCPIITLQHLKGQIARKELTVLNHQQQQLLWIEKVGFKMTMLKEVREFRQELNFEMKITGRAVTVLRFHFRFGFAQKTAVSVFPGFGFM